MRFSTQTDINYNLDDEGLEYWMLFCIAVAGKNARNTRAALNKFLSLGWDYDMRDLFLTTPTHEPFEKVRFLSQLGKLTEGIRKAGLGQYNKLTKAFQQVVDTYNGADLRKVSADDLMEIHGIGPKTARYFILSTREGTRYAALDTHILKYLRARGYEAPMSTPTSIKKYNELEQVFLALSDEAGKPPAEFDYEIWLSYRR